MATVAIELSSDESSGPDLPGTIDNNINSKASSVKMAKTQKLAKEKAAKKYADEIDKVYKPGVCMQYMVVEGHPSLWENWWCADVSRELSATGARLTSSTKLLHPSLVVWSRVLPRTMDSNDGQLVGTFQLGLSPRVEWCGRALYVCKAEALSERVCERSLAPHLVETKMLADCELTLVVFGVKEYFKSSRRKTTNSNRTVMTEIDFELAITDLLVSAECDTVIVNTPNELALLILQMTKAIAQAPHKLRARTADEHSQYYLRGDGKHCVAMDKDGVAVGKVWQQMLAVLPHSSLEISRALCAQYQTPLDLFKEVQSSDSVAQLADIGVSRAAVPGSRARRVGPEFARKLRTLFTADDGNTIID